MGKVLKGFGNGSPGAVSRSADRIVTALKNAGTDEIPFGAPVFLAPGGAAGFSTESPQDFETFLGFAVRVADKTPDDYPRGQDNDPQAGAWQPGDVMEVLVRGGIIVPMATGGTTGGKVYIRKSDGELTSSAGTAGSTVALENVRIRNPRNLYGATCEVIVNERNLI